MTRSSFASPGPARPAPRRGGRLAARVRGGALLAVLFVALLGAAGDAAALDPALQLSQYGHTAWRIRDGYFGGVVNALAQTADGFLWIGTDNGLYRFDGVHFSEWRPPAGQALPDPRVIRLLVARDGSLWIGTFSGLARWHEGQLTVHADQGRFGALAEDGEGTVWAGRTRIAPPLCRFRDAAFDCLAAPLPAEIGAFVSAIFEDRRGRLWLGGENGICGWPTGGLSVGSPGEVTPECLPIEVLRDGSNRSGLFGVFTLAEDDEGRLLADAGPSGLWRYAGAGWQPIEGTAGSPLHAASLLRGAPDGLFVGTYDLGLVRLLPGRQETFSPADGLSGALVMDLLEDREGNLWVATIGGLDRFRDLKIATFTAREGLEGTAAAVTSTAAGGVWVAAGAQLLHLSAAGVVSARSGRLPAGGRTTSLLEDSRGRLWLGVDDGLWQQEGQAFAPVRLPDGGNTGIVRALVEDRDGDLWAAVISPRSILLRIRQGKVVERHSPEELGGPGVVALAADPEGGLWAGLRGGELVRWQAGAVVSRQQLGAKIYALEPNPAGGVWVISNQGLLLARAGRIDRLDGARGLPCEDLQALLAGADGALWIKAPCGLIGIAATEVAAWLEDPQRKVAVRLRDARDGALAGRSSFHPQATRAADGRFYFVLQEGGVQVFDPARESVNRVPPPVAILRLLADGQEYGGESGRRLPALTRDVEIAYAALSFTDPDKVRFRYRLLGGDGEWREVGNRREAYFSSLPPGSYRFEVKACNNDGIWNEEGAAVAFAVLPAFYQTGAFRVAALLALAGAAWLFYRWRVHAFKADLGRRAEERLAERTLIARELHDTLLQGVLSSSMHLHVALAQLPPEAPVGKALQRAQQILAQVGEEGRDVLSGLRSSDRGADDLEAALWRVPGELAEANGAIHFEVEATSPARPLRPTVRDEVYRIAREALVNAYRHAGARAIAVKIDYAAKALRLVVSDDGCGIGADLLQAGREKHWGIAGMRERAGRIGARLAVESREGAGTRVELKVPGAIAYEDPKPRLAAKLQNFWRRLPAWRKREAPPEGTSR